MQPIDLAYRLLKNIDPMGGWDKNDINSVFASRRAPTEFDSEKASSPEVWERWLGEQPDDLSEWSSHDLDLAQGSAPTAEWHERLSNERVRRGINIIPFLNMIDVGRDNDKNPLPSNRGEGHWKDSVRGDFQEGLEDWQQKNASEPMDLAYRLLKTDIRFGEQDEDDTNVHHIDLTHYDMKDKRELPYTQDPPFQGVADGANRLVGYYDEDSPYYGYYDDLETTPEAERADYERKLDELDEESQRKLIQALMNADVNNAMWSAHGINQNIPSMDEDEKDKLIEAAREQVKPGKLYSHDDWYRPVPLHEGKIVGPHWFYPSDRAMARNLNPDWYDAKWIDGQFNPLALAPLDQKFRMTGREGEWSIQDLADEMKNASEPFEIAYRLLKMPIVPGSLKHTETDDLYNIEGQFLDDSSDDPEEHETMPIFLDWYKPKDGELGDIDIGINHPEDFDADWDDRLEEDEARRGALQFAQMPKGDYVPGPSMNATAVQVADNFRQRGYSTAMVEMLGELLSRTGDININPFVDGFTWHGFQMIQGIMQKKPEMAEQLRQHFMENIDKMPDALRNINMLNMLTSGEDIDKRSMFDRAAIRGHGSWNREAAQNVARKRQDRGGYNA